MPWRPGLRPWAASWRKSTKSSSRSVAQAGEPGAAASSSFFEHTFKSTPAPERSFKYCCRAVGHARARLAAHGKGLRAVVAHHAAPQGCCPGLWQWPFVFAEQGLDDARHAVRQRGDIRHGARIFVSVPRRGLAPAKDPRWPKASTNRAHKVCVLRGPIGHKGVHAAHKAHAPGRGHGVKVAQHAHIRQLEVVLHHGQPSAPPPATAPASARPRRQISSAAAALSAGTGRFCKLCTLV